MYLEVIFNVSELFISAIYPHENLQIVYNFKIISFLEIALVFLLNPLSSNHTKWSNTLKQFVGNLPTNCLSVFDHFVGLALKELNIFGETLNLTNL